jgi:hypothetical protein
MRRTHKGLGRLSPASMAALVMAASLVTGCDTQRLLDVTTPNQVPVSVLDDPANATLAVNSAVGDFQCALGATIVVEGLISGEMNDAQLGASQWDYARRTANTITNGSYGTNDCGKSVQVFGVYLPLSRARYDADHAVSLLKDATDAVPNRSTLLAAANLYAGLSYGWLGMTMCEAAFDNGPAVKQKGMFALAEQRLTDAITGAQAVGASADSIRFASLVLRARMRLYQGNPTGAAADAQLVPKGFIMNASNSSTATRLYNYPYYVTKNGGYFSIPSWSQNMQTEQGEVDPRSATQLANTRSANNNATIVYTANKYLSGGLGGPTPIARYEEAQLILAEVQGGAQAVAIINAMRADVGLKPYVGPIDAASIKNLVIDERRRVLFLEGQRNYDIERFAIPFNPPVGTTFPVGGGSYGNTTCLPLPDIEKNNNPTLGPSFVASTTGT